MQQFRFRMRANYLATTKKEPGKVNLNPIGPTLP